MRPKDGSRSVTRNSWDDLARYFDDSLGGCVVSIMILPLLVLGIVFTLAGIAYQDFFGFLAGLAFLALVGGLVVIKHKVTVRHLKAAQSARDEEAQDIDREILAGWTGRTYFVYLRPFETTGQMNIIVSGTTVKAATKGPEEIIISRPTVEFEALLRKALEPWGPLIGLGTPGEHLGAGRMSVEDAGWQAVVRRWIRSADTVFIIPGGGFGALWEFRYLFKRGYLKRTVVVMPPEALDLDIASLWLEARSALAPAGVKLPEYLATGAFILLAKNGRPKRVSRMPNPLDESNLRDTLKELI